MTGRNVLVTGSAGFVGKSVVKALKQRGDFVVGIDRIPELLSDCFIQHDLRTPLPAGLAARIPELHVCIHLASSVGGFLHNNATVLRADNELEIVHGLKQILDRYHCTRIIYTSSINVFETSGDFGSGPLQKFDQRTPYAQGKAQAEAYIANHFSSFIIVRPTNIFGAAQKLAPTHATIGESHVIPELWTKIQRAQNTVAVLGDGTQERNFLHVSDLTSFLLAVLTEPDQGWFNIRSNLQLPIAALARELLLIAEKEATLLFHPEYMQWEPKKIIPFDISPATKLGWYPQISSLKQGLLF